MNEQRTFVDLTTELLQRGTPIRFRATGISMQPTIANGETIIIEPVLPSEIEWWDIILYKTQTGVIAHRVIQIKAMEPSPQMDCSSSEAPLKRSSPLSFALLKSRFQRDDPQGRSPLLKRSAHGFSALSHQHSLLTFLTRGDAFETPDGPVKPDQILGRVVSVERNGRCIDLGGKKAKVLFLTRNLASRLKGQIGRIPIVAPTIRRVCRRGSVTSNLSK